MSNYETEYLLSEVYGLNPPRLRHRMIKTRRMKQMKIVFQKFKDEFSKNEKTIVSFDGYKNKCANFTTSSTDYNFQTLSVRTSLVKRTKVYPQYIGRTTTKQFFHKFKRMKGFHDRIKDKEIKQFITDNLGELINTYLDCLFHTDDTLWIYGNNHNDVKKHKYVIVNINQLPDLSEDVSLVRDVKNWNQFNKVKYNGITIGEFRLSNKRIEFGFFIHKLLNVIEMGQAVQSLLNLSSDGGADEVESTTTELPDGDETETDSVSTTSTLTIGTVTDVSSDDSYQYIPINDNPNISSGSVFCTVLKNIFCFINLSIPLTILIVLLVSEYEKIN